MSPLSVTEVETRSETPENMGPDRLKGFIARCSRGRLGLITEDLPREVVYPDGTMGMAYVGVHLGPSQLGQPWSSRAPDVARATTKRTFAILMALIKRAQKIR